MRNFSRLKRKAASLVITLMVIVLLSIIVVAFMQSMTMARANAKSYRWIEQANLAAEAGVDAAISQILVAIADNQAFVTGLTNFPNTNFPVTVIGRQDLTNATQMMPLISGPVELLSGFGTPGWDFQTYAKLRAELPLKDTVDLNTPSKFIQVTDDTDMYRVPWVTITNSSAGRPNYVRYAYVVVDEQARLNPALHTGKGGGLTNSTNWYTGPSDLILTKPQAQIIPPEAEALISLNPGAYGLSQESAAYAFTNRAAFDAVKHCLTTATNATYDFIPSWLADGGKPKYNLNDLATNTVYGDTSTLRAENIGEIIRRNLTNFSSRDPALRTRPDEAYRYPNRLAANIVDYIDSDSSPTAVNGGEPAGRDLFPMPTLIVQRHKRTTLSETSTTIETQVFVQLWNPYNTTIDLRRKTARYFEYNRMYVLFGGENPVKQPFEDYDQTITINQVARPNEFIVLEFPTVTQDFPALPLATPPKNPKWEGTGSAQGTPDGANVPFQFFLQGELVDMSRRPPIGPSGLNGLSSISQDAISGIDRGPRTLSRTANYWSPAWIQYTAANAAGDPRFNPFSNFDWWTDQQSYFDEMYTKTVYFKGRQNYSTKQYAQNFSLNWVNLDYVPRNPTPGKLPSTINTLPSAVASAWTPDDGLSAIAVLRNGPMVSIGELGHIFDPSHGNFDLKASIAGSGANKSYFGSGGGRTLRVGQPEFSSSSPDDTWNTNSRRAIELLDLFTINNTNTGAIGRINPNTAPKEVLAASLAGISVSSDEGIPASTLKNLPDIADIIITNRPYQALSDLHKVLPAFATGDNYSPSFGSIPVGTTNLAAMDRVREEVFGKWVQHLALQSRTYRIYAAGQNLDAAGKPKSSVLLEVVVQLQYDEQNHRFVPIVQHRKSLK